MNKRLVLSKETLLKTAMQTSLVSGLMATLATTVLSGCGSMNQDPLHNYPLSTKARPVENADDLKPHVREVPVVKEVAVDRPVYYAKEPEQNYVAAQLFQINNLTPVSFVAGQEGQVNFEIRILQGEADFSAQVVDMPGAKLEAISNEANKKVFRLTYKPAVDAIQGKSREKNGSLKIQLDLKSIKGANEEKTARLQKAFKAVSNIKSFDLVIRRDERTPTLQLVGFPSLINEGEKKSFSVKVKAPGTYEGFEPQVVRTYDFKGLTGSTYENDGSVFVRPTAGKKLIEKSGDGEWTLNFDVDTTLFAVPAQLDNKMQVVRGADGVNLRLSFMVVSPSGSTSDAIVAQYKIKYKGTTETKPQTAVAPAPSTMATPAPAGTGATSMAAPKADKAITAATGATGSTGTKTGATAATGTTGPTGKATTSKPTK